MAFETIPTLQPSTIERLNHTAHVYIGKRCITIVRIASETGPIRECVPEAIEGAKQLQYLSLTQNAALEAFGVFAHKCELSQCVKTTFMEWTKTCRGFSGYLKDDTILEWDGVMRIMGVQELCINALLDPRFAKLRREPTARFWVIRKMEEKWKHSVELNQKTKSDLAEIEAVKHCIHVSKITKHYDLSPKNQPCTGYLFTLFPPRPPPPSS